MAVLAGAVVQGTVGLGLGLVAAPIVTLVEPSLMPGLILLLAAVLPVVTLWREHHEIDWHGLRWSLPARVIGTAAGVWLVATVSDRALGLVVGVMVLLAVTLTVSAVDLPVNRVSLTSAGLVSGVTGTATSIGGPPMAILYQHRSPRQARSTLAVYFIVGAVLSLIGLAPTGQVSWLEVRLALVLVPVLIVGTLLAGPLRRRVGQTAFRAGVLVVCATSAGVLILRSLPG